MGDVVVVMNMRGANMDKLEREAVEELEATIVKLRTVKKYLFSQIKSYENRNKELLDVCKEILECHRCKEIDDLDACVLEQLKQAINK